MFNPPPLSQVSLPKPSLKDGNPACKHKHINQRGPVAPGGVSGPPPCFSSLAGSPLRLPGRCRREGRRGPPEVGRMKEPESFRSPPPPAPRRAFPDGRAALLICPQLISYLKASQMSTPLRLRLLLLLPGGWSGHAVSIFLGGGLALFPRPLRLKPLLAAADSPRGGSPSIRSSSSSSWCL